MTDERWRKVVWVWKLEQLKAKKEIRRYRDEFFRELILIVTGGK